MIEAFDLLYQKFAENMRVFDLYFIVKQKYIFLVLMRNCLNSVKIFSIISKQMKAKLATAVIFKVTHIR